MPDLRGKYIWLVGASAGIGAALAQRLANAGAYVALSSRNEAELTKLRGTLSGANHMVVPLDVTDLKSLEAAWGTLLAKWPGCDMVIYNAGAYQPMSARKFNLQVVEKVVDVNLHGVLRMLSLVLPYFVSKNRGHIAIVASVAGYRGLPAAMGYGLSKAALINLAESLRTDLYETNIGVQVINPGFVATQLTAKNEFKMPAIITPEQAAQYIEEGLKSDKFEIHFPKRFTLLLKFMKLLPDKLYFRLLDTQQYPDV